jgi:membrane protease YdiL (CAAX protease family)
LSEDNPAADLHILPPGSGHSGDLASEKNLPRSARWGFWATLIWGAVIGAIFVALQTIVLIVALAYRYGNHPHSELEIQDLAINGAIIALATLVTTVGCSAVVVGAIKLKKGAVISEYLDLKRIEFLTTAKWVGALAILIIMSDVLATSLGRPIVPEFVAHAYKTAGPLGFVWFALALVIAAPLSEEIYFRGFLFSGFEASFLGPFGTILVTAGLWALVHVQYDAYDVATVFALGLLLGSARRYTGSLLTPMVLHAVANMVAVTETAILS